MDSAMQPPFSGAFARGSRHSEMPTSNPVALALTPPKRNFLKTSGPCGCHLDGSRATAKSRLLYLSSRLARTSGGSVVGPGLSSSSLNGSALTKGRSQMDLERRTLKVRERKCARPNASSLSECDFEYWSETVFGAARVEPVRWRAAARNCTWITSSLGPRVVRPRQRTWPLSAPGAIWGRATRLRPNHACCRRAQRV